MHTYAHSPLLPFGADSTPLKASQILSYEVPADTHTLPSCSPANLPACSHMSLTPVSHQHEDIYICMHTRYQGTQPKHDSMAELVE